MKPPNFGLRAARVFDKYFRQMINWKLGDWDLKSYDMSVVDSVDVANGTLDLTLNNSPTKLTAALGKASPTAGDVIPLYKTWRERKHWVEVLSQGWCKTWTLNAEFEAPGTLFDNFMKAQGDQLQLTVLPAGDGRDGAYSQNFTGPIPGTEPWVVTDISGNGIVVWGTWGPQVGDKVMLHASISGFSDLATVGNVGYWQVLTVASRANLGATTEVFFDEQVNASNFGDPLTVYSQAQWIPQFTTVSIGAGHSITPAWAFNAHNYTSGPLFGQADFTGGVVAFMSNTLVQGPGNVSANGFGMPGGAYDHTCDCSTPTGGARSGWSGWGASTDRSIPSLGGAASKLNPTFGGGGGGFCGDNPGGGCCPVTSGFSPSGGGGGGGLVGSGVNGENGTVFSSTNAAGGAAGGAIPFANDFGYAFLGSGGGGSGTNTVFPNDGTGGRGGGVVLIWANTVSTLLQADGADGASARQGGGGSGGTVRLYYLPGANLTSLTMHANAGNGRLGVDFGGSVHWGAGGNGGLGSIQAFQIQPRVGCWTSEVVSAINVTPPLAPGTLLTPSNFLTDWLLDSDAIRPLYQIMSSPTGDFTGEETYYPGPTSSDYYQDGTSHDINDGASLALAFAPALYWKVRMCLDSGTNVANTPSVQDMQLCGY